jgi:Zn-finger nucleic acid-binding protein
MSDAWDDRKKAMEEDYFRRKEQETIEKLRAQMTAEQQAKEAVAATLQCPRCEGRLMEITFEQIQVDRCDKCGGVWLDAGELESLTKREGGGWLGRLWGSQ